MKGVVVELSALDDLELAVEACSDGLGQYLAASNLLVILEADAMNCSQYELASLLRHLHVNIEKLCQLPDVNSRQFYRAICHRLLRDIRKVVQ